MRNASVILTIICLAAGCVRNAPETRSVGPMPPVLRDAPPQFLRDLNAQVFQFIELPAQLPADVQEALREELGQKKLSLAAPRERFNAGCLWDPNLPSQRLLHAALNERFAIINYESGGFAPSDIVIVFGRTPGTRYASTLWATMPGVPLTNRDSFARAIATGALWESESPRTPAP